MSEGKRFNRTNVPAQLRPRSSSAGDLLPSPYLSCRQRLVFLNLAGRCSKERNSIESSSFQQIHTGRYEWAVQSATVKLLPAPNNPGVFSSAIP